MNELKKLQIVFQTLSDYNRLNILKAISEKEYAVGEIVKITGLSQPLVSHHLRTLKENGVLLTKRNGPFIYYYIKNPKILYAIDLFIEIFKDSEISDQDNFSFCTPRMFKRFKNIK